MEVILLYAAPVIIITGIAIYLLYQHDVTQHTMRKDLQEFLDGTDTDE